MINPHQLRVFETVAAAEHQLEKIRTDLNQEIQFNLRDLYVAVCGSASCVNRRHLWRFIGKVDEEALSNCIGYYNQNSSHNLTLIEFSSMFLSRKNKLLAMIVVERESLGILPNYILNMARDILIGECRLHQKLVSLRLSESSAGWSAQHTLEVGRLEEALRKALFSEEQVADTFNYLLELSCRHFSPNRLRIVLGSHCQEKIVSKRMKPLRIGSSPNLRFEFEDCLERVEAKELAHYRQVKSIQKHQTRLAPPKEQVVRLKHEEKIFGAFRHLRSVLLLEQDTEALRSELCLCPDFYPVLFFQGFWKDTRGHIAPSSVQEYLGSLGVSFDISLIFVFFRRYVGNTQCKMDFNEFCSIFDVCDSSLKCLAKNREVVSLEQVSLATKKTYLTLLATAVLNEWKIQNQKRLFAASCSGSLAALRGLDRDGDGVVSQEQIEGAWKECLGFDMTSEQLKLLWMRTGSRGAKGVRVDWLYRQLLPHCKKKPQ